MTMALLWAVRLVIVLLVLRFVIRALMGRRPARAQTAQRLGGTLVRDPQCGTYLTPARALTVSRGREVLHFCSDDCRDGWTKSRGHGGRPAR
jgi:hypothetical protein